jgi:hypothetical protein
MVVDSPPGMTSPSTAPSSSLRRTVTVSAPASASAARKHRRSVIRAPSCLRQPVEPGRAQQRGVTGAGGTVPNVGRRTKPSVATVAGGVGHRVAAATTVAAHSVATGDAAESTASAEPAVAAQRAAVARSPALPPIPLAPPVLAGPAQCRTDIRYIVRRRRQCLRDHHCKRHPKLLYDN